MARFFDEVIKSFESEGLDTSELRKARRIAQVRELWTKLVDQPILDHTNGVYIFQKNGQLEMHVYMDSSLFASEVSNRRSLIFQECRIKYKEPIDDFFVHVSRGQVRTLYPFRQATEQAKDQNPPVPLDDEEIARVDNSCKNIKDPALLAAFRQAMISDLEWKKGNR